MRSLTPMHLARLRSHPRLRNLRGFSLIELVVVVIVIGVLAAIAVPRYIAMGRDARIAAVNAMAGTLRSTSENVRAMCMLAVGCDYANPLFGVTIGGRSAVLNYGWLDASDAYGGEIDDWVDFSGFTPVKNGTNELYTLDGSPDPTNCSVTYYDAWARGPGGILIVTTTSGC